MISPRVQKLVICTTENRRNNVYLELITNKLNWHYEKQSNHKNSLQRFSKGNHQLRFFEADVNITLHYIINVLDCLTEDSLRLYFVQYMLCMAWTCHRHSDVT